KYFWETFTLGDLSRLELIKATEKGSFLENFLRNKEGGIHHLVLQTPDIKMTRKILDDNKVPYFGFNDYGDKWKELFIHPRDAFGVLLQIAEFKPRDWLDPLWLMPEGAKWSISKNMDKYLLTIPHPGGGKVDLKMDGEELKKLIQELSTIAE
ncbi:MAG: hypothetical protein ACW99L_18305, partial [Promethearchaeota archaeon]